MSKKQSKRNSTSNINRTVPPTTNIISTNLQKNKIFLTELKWLILSLVIGYLFAINCVGFAYIHNISNISYLYQDTLQHFLGWNLFKYDEWRWPITNLYVLTYNLPQQSNFSPPYFRLGMIAAINGLTTNKFYVARGDSQKNIMSTIDDFLSGKLINEGSVYIVDNQILSQLQPQYLKLLNCRVIDNYTVCKKYL